MDSLTGEDRCTGVENGGEAEVMPAPRSGSETERTISQDRLCRGCGASLVDRRPQARFCSARCRTQARRDRQSDRVAELLDTLTEAVARLCRELDPARGTGDAAGGAR